MGGMGGKVVKAEKLLNHIKEGLHCFVAHKNATVTTEQLLEQKKERMRTDTREMATQQGSSEGSNDDNKSVKITPRKSVAISRVRRKSW